MLASHWTVLVLKGRSYYLISMVGVWGWEPERARSRKVRLIGRLWVGWGFCTGTLTQLWGQVSVAYIVRQLLPDAKVVLTSSQNALASL